jgi:glycosyltransferase involved in cell wall biosynthesis
LVYCFQKWRAKNKDLFSIFGVIKNLFLKILLLIPAPLKISPSQRFRIEQYLFLENNNGIEFYPKPFFSPKTWKVFHVKAHVFQKVYGIVLGMIKRLLLSFSLHKYDFVYVHKEASPVGPPIVEWLFARVFKKKLIYDFDDNIWTPQSSEANPGAALVKCNWKVSYICKYSHIVTVGNEFLANYARKYNNDVRIIPTVVNTSNYHNKIKNQHEGKLTIGWTGTYTNLHNLTLVEDVIHSLQQKYEVDFLIIANKDPKLTTASYRYKKWSIESEIEDLLEMNIGIMPLAGSEIEMGKCGFKAIQYMSLGIPAVVSPVGANKNIISDQQEGYWANDKEEWYHSLEKLIKDATLRSDMGLKGRNKIIAEYSVDACKNSFFNLFY